MFDIEFTRECQQSTEVEAKINMALPVQLPILGFTWETGHQYSAALLQEHLNKQLRLAIENAHRLAYEQGYKDGRGKQRKKRRFTGDFHDNKPAW